MSLSKLHVRFIQSQKNFYLSQGDTIKEQKLPISQLYVKDTSSFYLVVSKEPLAQTGNLIIAFKEKTPALNTLECHFKTTQLANNSEEYEDALLFFNVDEAAVKQVLFLELASLSDS